MRAEALDDDTSHDRTSGVGPQSGFALGADHIVAGRYRLLSRIGRGGQGEVWEAEDRIVGDAVALKILPHGFGADAARARREIATLRLLRLPGVVHLRDEGVDGERAFLVMDRIVGTPFPGESSPCTWEWMEPRAMRLLETLERIHAAGVVHRDLKPSNVLVDADGRPTVLDFGISQFGFDPSVTFTHGEPPLGTPRYLAPEQLLGDTVTARTDLYAVGLFLFEALAGQLPHGEGNLRMLLIARLTQPLVSLRKLAPGVPPAVADAIERMLAPAPEDRPRSAAEVLALFRGGRPMRTEVFPKAEPLSTTHVLKEEDLRPLFAGPDRLLHLQEDAARALFRCTDGVPSRVAAEVAAWVQAGFARWHEGKLVVDRDTLERIEMGFVRGLALPDALAPLPARLAERLAWVALAWPTASLDVLQAAIDDASGSLDADLEELVRLGLARRTAEGNFEPLVAAPSDALLPEARRAAHAALARVLPEGGPRRLLHLVAGCDEGSAQQALEIAREAVILGEKLAEEGQLGKAMVALEEGLRALRNAGCPPEEAFELLSLWVQIALSDGTPRVLDRVLYEILRIDPTTKELAALAELVRAGLALGTWDDRAMSIVENIKPFAEADLERQRQALRLLASRRCSVEREGEMVDDVAEWAANKQDPLAEAIIAQWRGRFAYRTGRFAEAARLNLKAAEGGRWLHERLRASIEAASSLVEIPDFEKARSEALRVHQIAQRCRHQVLEGFAEFVLRLVDFRAELELEPDQDLTRAAAHIGAPDVEGAICATEAAIAFRAAQYQTARALAHHAHEIWAAAPQPVGADIMGALSFACGGPLVPSELRAIEERAYRCHVPGIGIQTLALLVVGGYSLGPAPAEFTSLAETVPRSVWHVRLDVYSVNESMAILSDKSKGLTVRKS